MRILLIAVRDELVWIDCEMTGLDLKSDRLIEIAALVTDADLNILGDGIDVVIHADDAALDGMVEVVATMHDKSGLTEEVRASTVDVPTAEEMVLDYIRGHVKQAKTAPLAGNSIATDRGFIARDMPDARRLPALPDDRRQLDQGAVPTLVSADLLRPAGEGPGAPRAGRHPRVDPRAEVLPAAPRSSPRPGRRPATSPRSPPNSGRPPTTRGNRFGHRAPERLVSTTPRALRLGGNGGCSSVGRAPGCDPGCRGFESRQPPQQVGGRFRPPTFSSSASAAVLPRP